MSGWVCHWKPFWIPVGESFQKAYSEECIPMGDDSSGEQCMANIPRWYRVLVTKIKPPNKSYLKKHLQHQDQRGSLMLLPGNLLGPRVLHPSGKERRHHCPSLPRPRCNFIHPKQLSPFPERLEFAASK